MSVEAFDGGEAAIHQIFQDISISSFGPGAKVEEEGTGWGWKTVSLIKAKDTVLPTTCKIQRP